MSEWLAHYGVKGMKWGVRKEQTPSAISKKQGIKLTKKQKAAIGWTLAGVAISFAGAKLVNNDKFVSFVGKVVDKLNNKTDSINDLYREEGVVVNRKTGEVISDFDIDSYLQSKSK